jgi:hypothetical protein
MLLLFSTPSDLLPISKPTGGFIENPADTVTQAFAGNTDNYDYPEMRTSRNQPYSLPRPNYPPSPGPRPRPGPVHPPPDVPTPPDSPRHSSYTVTLLGEEVPYRSLQNSPSPLTRPDPPTPPPHPNPGPINPPPDVPTPPEYRPLYVSGDNEQYSY